MDEIAQSRAGGGDRAHIGEGDRLGIHMEPFGHGLGVGFGAISVVKHYLYWQFQGPYQFQGMGSLGHACRAGDDNDGACVTGCARPHGIPELRSWQVHQAQAHITHGHLSHGDQHLSRLEPGWEGGRLLFIYFGVELLGDCFEHCLLHGQGTVVGAGAHELARWQVFAEHQDLRRAQIRVEMAGG
ncbi:hypothetical protein [Nocardiopsis nanhaiensis]